MSTRAKYLPIRVLAAKLEANNGIPESVTGTDATFKVFGPQLTPDDNTIERELQAAQGMEKDEPGPKSGKLTFDTEIVAPTAAIPAWASVFLPACDMENTTGTFAFTAGTNTITAVFYEDGKKRTFYGGRGTFRIMLPTGQIPKFSWEFTGKYLDTDADGAILSPTYEAALSPIFAGGSNTCTIGSFRPHCANLEIDANNHVVLRETANDPHTDSSGYVCAAIPNRNPSGSMDPEATSVASRDWRGIRAAKTSETLTIVHGSVAASNRVTISSTTFQTISAQSGNRNELLTDQVRFKLHSASPFTIDFTDV